MVKNPHYKMSLVCFREKRGRRLVGKLKSSILRHATNNENHLGRDYQPFHCIFTSMTLRIDAAKITPLFGIKGFIYMLCNLAHLFLVSFPKNRVWCWNVFTLCQSCILGFYLPALGNTQTAAVTHLK